MRKTCIEPISFNQDGSITEVEMTSQGAGMHDSMLLLIRMKLLTTADVGNVRIESREKDNDQLGKITDTDNAAYKYINSVPGQNRFKYGLHPEKTVKDRF